MVRVTVVCKIPLLARATIGYLVRIQGLWLELGLGFGLGLQLQTPRKKTHM